MSEQKGDTQHGSNQIGALERGQGLARQERSGQPNQNRERPVPDEDVPEMSFADSLNTGGRPTARGREKDSGHNSIG